MHGSHAVEDMEELGHGVIGALGLGGLALPPAGVEPNTPEDVDWRKILEPAPNAAE